MNDEMVPKQVEKMMATSMSSLLVTGNHDPWPQ